MSYIFLGNVQLFSAFTVIGLMIIMIFNWVQGTQVNLK